MWVCRKCHMKSDGRIAKLKKMQRVNAKNNIGKIRVARIKRVCKNCQKEFEVEPGKVKLHKYIFCSQGCMGQYQVGKNNPNYRNGLYIEKTICPVCRKKYKNKIDKEFIEKISMCANCDHNRADLLQSIHRKEDL